MKVLNQWAVVTGASKGLGFQYCKELLSKGYNIIGVSRNAQAILALKKDYPDLEIKTYDLDLSNIENVYKLYDECEKFNVTLLINNAGYGILGKFQNTNLEKELNMLNLNICALHALTKLFAQKFIKSNYGRIINISSIVAFAPGPGFSSYFASKSYVLRLGIAINTELKYQKSKVRVVTICPGHLKTNFFIRAGEGNKGASYDPGIPAMPLEVFARKSLNKGLKTKNKNYFLFGFLNRILVFFMKVMPKRILLRSIYKQRNID